MRNSAFRSPATFANLATTSHLGIIMVVSRRTKWHLMFGLLVSVVFVYPCLFGIDAAASPVGYWFSKAFLFLFVAPVACYFGWQLKHQEEAITIENQQIRFATMTPWGRSSLHLEDIVDCSFERIPEVCDHLILTVTPSCFARESKSRTWVACEGEQLRFDMMYTSPGSQATSASLRQRLRAAASSIGEQDDARELPITRKVDG